MSESQEASDLSRAEELFQGMLEARRADLMRVFSLRFRGILPLDLVAAVRDSDDYDRLGRWFDAALLAPSLEAFRHAAQLADDAAAVLKAAAPRS